METNTELPWVKSKSPTGKYAFGGTSTTSRVPFIPNDGVKSFSKTDELQDRNISSPILWTPSVCPIPPKKPASPVKVFDVPDEITSDPSIRELDSIEDESSVLSVLKRFNPGNKVHVPCDVHYNGNMNDANSRNVNLDQTPVKKIHSGPIMIKDGNLWRASQGRILESRGIQRLEICDESGKIRTCVYNLNECRFEVLHGDVNQFLFQVSFPNRPDHMCIRTETQEQLSTWCRLLQMHDGQGQTSSGTANKSRTQVNQDDRNSAVSDQISLIPTALQSQIDELKAKIDAVGTMVRNEIQTFTDRSTVEPETFNALVQAAFAEHSSKLESSWRSKYDSIISDLESLDSKLTSFSQSFDTKSPIFAKKEDISKVSQGLQKSNAILHELQDRTSVLQAHMTAFASNPTGRLSCMKCNQDETVQARLDDLKSSISLLVSRSSVTAPANMSQNDNNQGLDRTAKNSIMSLNEKMIQLSKMSEHHQQQHTSKITSLDEKIGRVCKWINSQTITDGGSGPSNNKKDYDDLKNLIIQTDRDSLLRHNELHACIKRLDNQIKSVQENCFEVLSRSRGLDDDSRSQDTEHSLSEQLDNMRTMLSAEQEMTRDRMNQLLNMFTILQDAHVTLANKEKYPESGTSAPLDGTVSETSIENRSSTNPAPHAMSDPDKIHSYIKKEIQGAVKTFEKQIESQFKSFQSFLASYLPSDLEMRISSVETQLTRLYNSHQETRAPTTVSSQQRKHVSSSSIPANVTTLASDIISQNTSVLESLDSIQHNISRICDCIDSHGRISIVNSETSSGGDSCSTPNQILIKSLMQDFVAVSSREIEQAFDQIKRQKMSELKSLDEKKRVLQETIERLEGQRERHLGRLMVEKLSCETLETTRSSQSSRRST